MPCMTVGAIWKFKQQTRAMKLDFKLDSFGTEVLSNQLFEGIGFSDLQISPPLGSKVRVEKCQFIDCSTSPGTCWISSGVFLEDVIFSNLDCGGIRISSEVDLRRVVIKGEKPTSLVVQPESVEEFEMSAPKDVEFQLDISEFAGEVTIVGLRGKLVRKNPDRHVSVHESWNKEVDWKGLGIGPFSFWRIFIKKLSVCNAKEGVFSLPERRNKYFAEAMREKDLLEKAGVDFA